MSRLFPCLLLFTLCGMQPARALDGLGIELGSGEHTDMARATLRWNWDKTWPVGNDWTAVGFWEAGVGNWQGHYSGGLNLTELGVTPVFRLNSKYSSFYWEGAIGAHFMNQTRIDAHRNFGSHFNFGDHVGFGWRLGDRESYELGYRFQHLSNADTAMPNDSINFHQLRLGINFN